ncbi:MAG: hypothetical protein KDD61_06630 [Bdellovibrionales bacterium]|nr:hypothetical protein [Bdellovibrionales bacterium]
MSDVININDFKGRKKLIEYFEGYILCPKCYGYLHKKSAPCLDKENQSDAFSFPIYRDRNGFVYFKDENAMIYEARINGVVD